MQLYSLTLQKPTAATHAIQGNFSGPRVHEIVVARGRVLELLRLEEKSQLRSAWSSDVFGIIRSLTTFRLTGSPKDFLVIGSDSGRIVVLEFNSKKNCFEKVHQETFGKSGVRRIVPGQYLAADPKGRAVMIGSVERSKFVYVLNRDASGKLTISSPLEAHKSHQICFGMCGIDVGFENPVFASIEQNYENADKPSAVSPPGEKPKFTPPPKGVSFWEMDLGLNHVIKKCTLPCHDSAHLLIPVPGGSGVHEGPSGVIVCCENFLVYKRPDHPDIACALPRRIDMPQEGTMMITCFAMHRLRDFFFFLVQSEFGDIYKVELTHEKKEDKRVVLDMTIRYLDSVPVANSMTVLRSGFLFVASEFGNHLLYQFTGIGGDESDPVCSSLSPGGAQCTVAFQLRPLKNLTLVQELNSLSPITDMKILDAMNEGHPQIFAACGRGTRSSLRVLQYGVSVEELADNELPGTPLAVWTLREKVTDRQDGLIVVAFQDSTLILSIGENVAEVSDTNFLQNVASIHVALMADNSHVQIHQGGVRLLQPSKRVLEWYPPTGRRIVAAVSNDRQICVALTGGELLTFEPADSLTVLNEKVLGYEITSLSIQPTPEGRTRAPFVAVSGLDNTIRIFALDADADLRQVGMLGVPNGANADSVCLWQVEAEDPSGSHVSALYLFVGLETGILLRATVDRVTGELSDQRTRFLGPSGIKLHNVSLGGSSGSAGKTGMVALSTRPWLVHYSAQGRVDCIPMHYNKLEFVSSFCSAQCTDGFVAVSGRDLRIFQCSAITGCLAQSSIPLTYTPRKLCVLPPPSAQMDVMLAGSLGVPANPIPPTKAVLAVIEADHNVYDESTRQEIASALQKINIHDADKDEDSDDMEIKDYKEEEENTMPPEEQVGTFRAGPGKWGSCIRVIYPSTSQTICKFPLECDEAALCSVVCRFWEFDSPCLVVGTATRMTLRPRKSPQASIKVFAYNSDYKLHLIHSTSVEAPPLALCAWDGRLIASLGKKIRVFSLGRKKLLKKCEFKAIPEAIVWLRVVKDRIYAGDVREGFMVLKYRSSENALHVISEQSRPQWITCGEILDYHTVVGGDKFDSIVVARVPEEAKELDVGGMGGHTTLRMRGDTPYIATECPKLEYVANFHVAETLTAIQKATLTPGGSEAIVYSTVMGSIGALLPLLTKDEGDMLSHLEMAMRTITPPLCGRDPVAYRSYYAPSKAVIDGDLCELFHTLTPAQQKSVASDVSRTPLDILKKLEEIRNRVL